LQLQYFEHVAGERKTRRDRIVQKWTLPVTVTVPVTVPVTATIGHEAEHAVQVESKEGAVANTRSSGLFLDEASISLFTAPSAVTGMFFWACVYRAQPVMYWFVQALMFLPRLLKDFCFWVRLERRKTRSFSRNTKLDLFST
jgi:hypothetical protein